MPLKVLIVGAGVSGLAALKECLAKGFSATIFEAQGHSGGQWRYTLPDPVTGEVQSSVYKGCVFNSSRDTSAFSDFPYDPARYPEYFGHAAFAQYLDEYTEFFDLGRHIRYNTRVVKSQQTAEGGWRVSFEQDGAVNEETFDALFACSGHGSAPKVPDFEGLSEYKGKFLHSHVYRTPGPFEGKRVAIIGIGSSAVDIASEVSPQAESCHLITRTGGWVIPKFVLGKSVDAFDSRLTTYLPASLSQWVQTQLLNFVQGKHPPELQPKHRILEAAPTLRTDFLEKVKVGSVIPHRAGVKRFTENGLILTNGTELEVDVVIACTGYLVDFPYLPSDSYRDPASKFIKSSNSVNLYELIVPHNYKNVFIIGLTETFGSAVPLNELQVRWCVSILRGHHSLPSPAAMKTWAEEFQLHLSKKYVHSDRHAIMVDFVPYLDRLAKPLGANPTFGKLLKGVFTGNPLTGLSVLNSVYMDVISSSQFRLFGDGACPELAKASIMRIAGVKAELSEGEKVGLQKLHENWRAGEVEMKDV